MKSPSVGCSLTAPVFTFLSFTPRSFSASDPSTSVTSLSHTKRIFGFLRARSCMIFVARSVSRRWITTTSVAKRVR